MSYKASISFLKNNRKVIQWKCETTKLCIVGQMFMMIKIQQNTSNYNQYQKRTKQKPFIKEERKQLRINLFILLVSFYTLKTTSGFRDYKKRLVA